MRTWRRFRGVGGQRCGAKAERRSEGNSGSERFLHFRFVSVVVGMAFTIA